MNHIEIREISREDIKGFHACLDEVAREKAYLGLEQTSPLAETWVFVEAAIKRGDVRVIASDGDTLVGWCDISPYRYPSMKHVGQLGMGVRKRYRGRGIGRQLLDRAVERARDIGIENVELDVFSSSKAAVQLYLSSGFEEEGFRSRVRKTGNT